MELLINFGWTYFGWFKNEGETEAGFNDF